MNECAVTSGLDGHQRIRRYAETLKKRVLSFGTYWTLGDQESGPVVGETYSGFCNYE